MAKHQRKIQQNLERRQKEVPSSGFYPDGTGKRIFMRRPGSQNKKKGWGPGAVR